MLFSKPGVSGIEKLEFFIIADRHTYLAFALAGVRGGVAETPAMARELLTQARKDPAVGLILITERLSEQIREEVESARRGGEKPFILEMPDLTGPLPKRESLLERVRALIGIPG